MLNIDSVATLDFVETLTLPLPEREGVKSAFDADRFSDYMPIFFR